ncbi:hypothetical protein HPC49_33060 [Pyxidicoccus fallax]|uniref:Outer membrane protein beta-barrel domain-containing protein n=1 Tax=Pyxidicoccus fallax TaxID=394095 RepID=A0A848LGQ8_9BACT|nr:hypothetical protein [Pyxidicoccus fallax]NMO16853.1 hypothetical protein [Pyxidicoccus fallax]NPC83039.1 hypothetical protein [Pyxidicoccus fallax]
MRVPSLNAVNVSKAVLLAVPLMAAPALADEAVGPIPGHERERQSAVLLELSPPALDASMYGIRLDIAPSMEGPFSFGLMGRAGQWGNSLGAKTRFDGIGATEIKLNYAVGADARYTLGSFANGTLKPFVGLTAGFEEFVSRSGNGPSEAATTAAFLEPTAGVMWRPGAGRVGLSARVGPGFTFTDTRDLQVQAGDLRLKPVYPTASLGLLVVL